MRRCQGLSPPRSTGKVTSRRYDPGNGASPRRVESSRALPAARPREEQAVELGFDAAATAMGTGSASARVPARTTAIRGVLFVCLHATPSLLLTGDPPWMPSPPLEQTTVEDANAAGTSP
ncbi:unnamed protein product [Urochloa humidicola]